MSSAFLSFDSDLNSQSSSFSFLHPICTQSKNSPCMQACKRRVVLRGLCVCREGTYAKLHTPTHQLLFFSSSTLLLQIKLCHFGSSRCSFVDLKRRSVWQQHLDESRSAQKGLTPRFSGFSWAWADRLSKWMQISLRIRRFGSKSPSGSSSDSFWLIIMLPCQPKKVLLFSVHLHFLLKITLSQHISATTQENKTCFSNHN